MFLPKLARQIGGWLVLGSILLVLRPARAADKPDTATINRLVSKLGSKDYQEREDASKALERLGKAALPALCKAAESPDPEVRRRAEDLLVKLDHGVKALAKFRVWLRYEGGTPSLPILKEVTLRHRDITDSDLIHLRGCRDLEMLTLECPKLTDAGLAYLSQLPNLRSLSISYTHITGKGRVRPVKRVLDGHG